MSLCKVKGNVTVKDITLTNKRIINIIDAVERYGKKNLWLTGSLNLDPKLENYLKWTKINGKSPNVIGKTYLCTIDISGINEFILHSDCISDLNSFR